MREVRQFGVFVFHDGAEEGVPLKYADSPEECATFRNSAEALREMDDRQIDYGICTEIVDLDSNKVVLKTTNGGKGWSVPAKGERLATPVPA